MDIFTTLFDYYEEDSDGHSSPLAYHTPAPSFHTNTLYFLEQRMPGAKGFFLYFCHILPHVYPHRNSHAMPLDKALISSRVFQSSALFHLILLYMRKPRCDVDIHAELFAEVSY